MAKRFQLVIFILFVSALYLAAQQTVFLSSTGGGEQYLFRNDTWLKTKDGDPGSPEAKVVSGNLATIISAWPVHKTATFNCAPVEFAEAPITFNNDGQVSRGTINTDYTGRVTSATGAPDAKSVAFKAGTEIGFAENGDGQVVSGTVLTNVYLHKSDGSAMSFPAGTFMRFNSSGQVTYFKESGSNKPAVADNQVKAKVVPPAQQANAVKPVGSTSHVAKFAYITYYSSSAGVPTYFCVSPAFEIAFAVPNYANDVQHGQALLLTALENKGGYKSCCGQTIANLTVVTSDAVNNAGTFMGIFLSKEQAEKSAERQYAIYGGTKSWLQPIERYWNPK